MSKFVKPAKRPRLKGDDGRIGISKIHRVLICLTPKAEADLKFVSKQMQVNQSEAIRIGLNLAASHVSSIVEKNSTTLPQLGKPK
jgi:hypothetical protein